MKATSTFALIPLLLVLLPGVASAEASVLANRPSHEDLLAKQDAHREKLSKRDTNLIQSGQLTRREDRAKRDIVDRSTVLSSGRNWTIVPKGAVLHVPSFLASRVNGEKSGPFVSWSVFQQQNRGWIHLQNVKMKQARGQELLPEGTADLYKSLSRVVVAVCHGGPISVMKVKEKDPAAGK